MVDDEETLGSNSPAVGSILKVTKNSYIWVSRSLFDYQKTQHVKWFQDTLKMFDKKQHWFVNNVVIVTIMQCHDVATKSQNKFWFFENKDSPITIRK